MKGVDKIVGVIVSKSEAMGSDRVMNNADAMSNTPVGETAKDGAVSEDVNKTENPDGKLISEIGHSNKGIEHTALVRTRENAGNSEQELNSLSKEDEISYNSDSECAANADLESNLDSDSGDDDSLIGSEKVLAERDQNEGVVNKACVASREQNLVVEEKSSDKKVTLDERIAVESYDFTSSALMMECKDDGVISGVYTLAHDLGSVVDPMIPTLVIKDSSSNDTEKAVLCIEGCEDSRRNLAELEDKFVNIDLNDETSTKNKHGTLGKPVVPGSCEVQVITDGSYWKSDEEESRDKKLFDMRLTTSAHRKLLIRFLQRPFTAAWVVFFVCSMAALLWSIVEFSVIFSAFLKGKVSFSSVALGASVVLGIAAPAIICVGMVMFISHEFERLVAGIKLARFLRNNPDCEIRQDTLVYLAKKTTAKLGTLASMKQASSHLSIASAVLLVIGLMIHMVTRSLHTAEAISARRMVSLGTEIAISLSCIVVAMLIFTFYNVTLEVDPSKGFCKRDDIVSAHDLLSADDFTESHSQSEHTEGIFVSGALKEANVCCYGDICGRCEKTSVSKF